MVGNPRFCQTDLIQHAAQEILLVCLFTHTVFNSGTVTRAITIATNSTTHAKSSNHDRIELKSTGLYKKPTGKAMPRVN